MKKSTTHYGTISSMPSWNNIQYSTIDMDEQEYASSVLRKLKSIFKNRDGAPEQIENYTVQNLCKRIWSVFDEKVLNINSIGKRRTILYKYTTSLELTTTRAFDNSHSEVATVINDGKCLRGDILKQVPRALTEPVPVDSILRGEVDPPDSLKLFFMYLYTGLESVEKVSKSKQMYVESSSADSVFACSGGKLLPRNQLGLGLTLKS